MKDFTKQLEARQELADATQEALDRLCTALMALHRHQNAMLRELRKAGVRVDSVRWLEGDTGPLAVQILQAAIGRGELPKVTIGEVVARENAAILAAIQTADDFSMVATRGRSWAGSAHAPQKDYSNIR